MNNTAILSEPIGLYIHIPFCKSKCHYCDFYSVIHEFSLGERYIECLLTEIESTRKHYGSKLKAASIYFGGGTPTILDANQLEAVLSSIRHNFDVDNNAEISLEANPESIRFSKLKSLIELGFNRISIGVQSFENDLLLFLGRIHDRDTALKAIKHAQQAGFDNISIDLMFGIPGQNDSSLISGIDIAGGLGLKHISLYGLTAEVGTGLYEGVKSGKVKTPDDDSYATQYMTACEELKYRGYERYEVSNFCIPGFECRHNVNYWKYGSYIGFGPSAHSAFVKNDRASFEVKRLWNVESLSAYVKRLQSGQSPVENCEVLEDDKIIIEKLMLALRMAEGCQMDDDMFKRLMAGNPDFQRRLSGMADLDLIKIGEDNRIMVTDRGFPVMDEIITELTLGFK